MFGGVSDVIFGDHAWDATKTSNPAAVGEALYS